MNKRIYLNPPFATLSTSADTGSTVQVIAAYYRYRLGPSLSANSGCLQTCGSDTLFWEIYVVDNIGTHHGSVAERNETYVAKKFISL